MEDKDPIVIIGSGLAGYMVAKELRKLNKDKAIQILTAGDGHFYSKPQLSTALTQKRSPEALSMGAPDAMSKQLTASIYTGCRVQKVDTDNKHVVCCDREFGYDKLVLAVGAEKLNPPLQGDGVDEVQSVNHLEEYAGFHRWLNNKKHIVILGSGLVGCEFANDLVNEGYAVDVVSPDAYPLASFVPEAIGRALQQALTDKGVRWNLCRFAESVNREGERFIVGTDTMQKISCDGVFSAIGLRPSVALAEKIGLQVNKGIVVNRHLQTSNPDIYALGDCAEVNGHVLLHIAPLLACARIIARELNDESAEVAYPAMPIIVKTPVCPIVSLPPLPTLQGEWTVEGEGIDLCALFHDKTGALQGFCLSGKCLAKRQELLKELPALFN